jgi:hypothetical protein
VTLGQRDLDEAREEQWNGSRRRGGAGLGVAEGGVVLDRLGVAEGVVEVRGEAKAWGGGARGRRPRCRSLGAVGGRRAHGSGAAAAGAQVVAHDADLSRVRERERGRARDVFLDKTITSVGHL